MIADDIIKRATISLCGQYRSTLERIWDQSLPLLLVVMFNPSDADAERNDPTVSLVCHIAAHNGYGGIIVENVCPLRSSTPKPAIAMLERAQCTPDADYEARKVLWDNVNTMSAQMDRAAGVLIAWGAMGGHAGDWCVTTMQELHEHRPAKPIFHLGKCANGHPKHPLARGKHKVPKDAPLLPWTATQGSESYRIGA
jgi:hypothetical protein